MRSLTIEAAHRPLRPHAATPARRLAALPVSYWLHTEDQLDAVTKEKLMEDLKVVAQDVEELLRATANQTGERVAAARARAEESLRSAQMRWSEARDDAAARARAAADAADGYVRDNPWQAIGIAAGLSFVIGLLIGRR
jgi:ElaB/YqjD/DUF883 family membrane-anchored ribosome-binding protein